MLKVEIDPGCPSDRRFVFSGEGDREPGREAGDIVVQLQEKGEHPTFQRHGRDLSMRMDLRLEEALCGFRRKIK